MDFLLLKEENEIDYKTVSPSSHSESNTCVFVDNSETLFDEDLNRTQEKCGEIFTNDCETFTILCTYCSTLLEDIGKFISHVRTHHSKTDNTEDPLKPVDDHEVTAIKLETNSQIELMNSAEVLKIRHYQSTSSTRNARDANKKAQTGIGKRRRKNGVSVACNICDEKFSSKRYLESHRKYDHLPTDPFIISLSTNNKYDTLGDDDDDLSNKEKVEETALHVDPLKCRYCDRRFATRRGRAEHECIHTGEKMYKCDLCDKCFRLNSIYNSHMKTHKNDRPYKCEVCNAAFKDRTNWNVHMRRHLGEKRFKCDYCDKLFVQSSEKKIHERIHTGEKPFQCVTCGNRFKTSSQMAAHNRIHAAIKPYKCKECNKGFITNTELKSHSVSHTGERPFSCEICQATFPRRKSLTSHIKIHSDIAEYVCKICDKAFKQGPGLYCHMKSHGRN